jgi:hypothetical protein
VDEIMDYYEWVEHPELAQDFYRELRALLLDASRRPDRYHLFKAGLRRANLKQFPYQPRSRQACSRVAWLGNARSRMRGAVPADGQ